MHTKKPSLLLGFLFIAYALGCFTLTFYLIQNPIEQTPDIPPVTLLPDLRAIQHTPERKQVFIETLLPIIQMKNRKILAERQTLRDIQARITDHTPLTRQQKKQLSALRTAYEVSEESFPKKNEAVAELLHRADVIPPSLVLAQAAVESAWGTSRFAVDALNLFGQWCYRKGCGLVPERREANARHEVRRFHSLEESLAAYFRNLNTHTAYRGLRQLRAQLQAEEKPLTGTALAGQLEKYSSRGQAYINELREVIRYNRLEQYTLEADPLR